MKPFRDKEENYYQFEHETDLEFQTLYNIVNGIFIDPSTLHEASKKIAQHLFDQSMHPHIKSGEVYVAYLENLHIDNEKVDGIGIFKSELKQDYLQFSETDKQLDAILQHGVSLNKLDKGALIFNTKKEEGYKVID